MANIKTLKSDLWVSCEATRGHISSSKRAQMLYTLILEEEVLTRISFTNKKRKGQYHIEELYNIVKSEFSGLCDDNCVEAKGYENMPKWKHVVRCAIQELKKNRVIRKGNMRGCWYFKG